MLGRVHREVGFEVLVTYTQGAQDFGHEADRGGAGSCDDALIGNCIRNILIVRGSAIVQFRQVFAELEVWRRLSSTPACASTRVPSQMPATTMFLSWAAATSAAISGAISVFQIVPPHTISRSSSSSRMLSSAKCG